MTEKLTGIDLVKEAIRSHIQFLRNLERSIEKMSAIDKDAEKRLAILIFGREVDIKETFSKRIGFAKIALKILEEEEK